MAKISKNESALFCFVGKHINISIAKNDFEIVMVNVSNLLPKNYSIQAFYRVDTNNKDVYISKAEIISKSSARIILGNATATEQIPDVYVIFTCLKTDTLVNTF